jgi:hypothetical protein
MLENDLIISVSHKFLINVLLLQCNTDTPWEPTCKNFPKIDKNELDIIQNQQENSQIFKIASSLSSSV